MHGNLSTNGAELLFSLLLLLPVVYFAGCALFNARLVFAGTAFSPLVKQGAPSSESHSMNFMDLNHRGTETQRRHREENSKFLLLVPAHDEEILLADTLRSLAALDYPRDAYQVVVIADNCTDRTAEIAREEGATVIERHDPERIGKGHALNYALSLLLNPSVNEVALRAVQIRLLREFPLCLCASVVQIRYSALVVLDADTLVAPNLLRAFADGLARGEKVQQARYDVRNPVASWRTRLLTCALALIHVAKPLGRERLGLSDSLKGNGMCFTTDIAGRIPWDGEALAEDLEYTLRLVREGVRVAFQADTAVCAAMPGSARSAAGQRRRWESGRWQLLRQAVPLLIEGLRTRNRLLTDRALELFIPPFAERFAVPVLLAALYAAAGRITHCSLAIVLAWTLFGILGIELITLASALRIARVPRSAVLSLLFAPVYIVWKFGLLLGLATRRKALRWQRTERTEHECGA